jgi:hypothetical protein
MNPNQRLFIEAFKAWDAEGLVEAVVRMAEEVVNDWED